MDQVDKPRIGEPRPVEDTLRESLSDLEAGRWEDSDSVLARVDRMIAEAAHEKAGRQADQPPL